MTRLWRVWTWWARRREAKLEAVLEVDRRRINGEYNRMAEDVIRIREWENSRWL